MGGIALRAQPASRRSPSSAGLPGVADSTSSSMPDSLGRAKPRHRPAVAEPGEAVPGEHVEAVIHDQRGCAGDRIRCGSRWTRGGSAPARSPRTFAPSRRSCCGPTPSSSEILRAARLLTVERRGTLRLYALNGDELAGILAQITSCSSAGTCDRLLVLGADRYRPAQYRSRYPSPGYDLGLPNSRWCKGRPLGSLCSIPGAVAVTRGCAC